MLSLLEIDDECESKSRMSFQLRRILGIYRFIAARRFVVSVDSIHEQNFDQWNVCIRTTYRDLGVLEAMGLISKVRLSAFVGYKLNLQA